MRNTINIQSLCFSFFCFIALLSMYSCQKDGDLTIPQLDNCPTTQNTFQTSLGTNDSYIIELRAGGFASIDYDRASKKMSISKLNDNGIVVSKVFEKTFTDGHNVNSNLVETANGQLVAYHLQTGRDPVTFDYFANEFIIKFTASGTLLWEKQLDYSENYVASGKTAILTVDDNAVVVFNNPISGGDNFSISKFNNAGEVVWKKTHSLSLVLGAIGSVSIHNGNFLVPDFLSTSAYLFNQNGDLITRVNAGDSFQSNVENPSFIPFNIPAAFETQNKEVGFISAVLAEEAGDTTLDLTIVAVNTNNTLVDKKVIRKYTPGNNDFFPFHYAVSKDSCEGYIINIAGGKLDNPDFIYLTAIRLDNDFEVLWEKELPVAIPENDFDASTRVTETTDHAYLLLFADYISKISKQESL